MGLAPSLGNGWVRFQPARSRKVGQISTGVDMSGREAPETVAIQVPFLLHFPLRKHALGLEWAWMSGVSAYGTKLAIWGTEDFWRILTLLRLKMSRHAQSWCCRQPVKPSPPF
jgi:hypothetical protein